MKEEERLTCVREKGLEEEGDLHAYKGRSEGRRGLTRV